MGSISCCDKRILCYFRVNREQARPEANIHLKRSKQKHLTSVLALAQIDNSNTELAVKQSNSKSPRNRTILEMDEKLKKIQMQQSNNRKELEKLSGKKLFAEVFS